MRYQDAMIQLTEDMMASVFRSARAMPEDKLTWKPMETGRSVLDQLQECAHVNYIFRKVLETRQPPNLKQEDIEQGIEERSKWTTIDECEKHAKENSEMLFDVIRSISDEDVLSTIDFGPDQQIKLMTAMSWHYQNLTYHHGQISYIQTLYGDSDPH